VTVVSTVVTGVCVAETGVPFHTEVHPEQTMKSLQMRAKKIPFTIFYAWKRIGLEIYLIPAPNYPTSKCILHRNKVEKIAVVNGSVFDLGPEGEPLTG
jgi:hypothetical protein